MANPSDKTLGEVEAMAGRAADHVVENDFAGFDDVSSAVATGGDGTVTIEVTINPPEDGWKAEKGEDS